MIFVRTTVSTQPTRPPRFDSFAVGCDTHVTNDDPLRLIVPPINDESGLASARLPALCLSYCAKRDAARVTRNPEQNLREEGMIRRVKRKIGPASLAQAEIGYQLELARGASVIASTLTNENMTAAIGESLATFVSAHGTADLQIFVAAACSATGGTGQIRRGRHTVHLGPSGVTSSNSATLI